MKKVFTMLTVCAATFAMYTASAGITPVRGVKTNPTRSATQIYGGHGSSLRAAGCDTITNLDLTGADSLAVYYEFQSPFVGYVSGNGALSDGTHFAPVTAIGEKLTDSASATGSYVQAAIAEFAYWTINPTATDSAIVITAYVYDTTGTGAKGEESPGNALDSATTTLGFIVSHGGALFTFSHHTTLPGRSFFITINLPQVTGDTLVLATNDGSSGNGFGYLNAPLGGGWYTYDTLGGGGAPLGNVIIAFTCEAAAATCPTIAVTATQTGHSAYATATGGVAPYTYAWSTTPAQTTDTATGLTVGSSYTVTATDHNGCTGAGSLSITGIQDLTAGVANFSVFPNPSNGVFTASVRLSAASDVTISITDVTGSKVFESTDRVTGELNKPINLSAIASGMYIVTVRTAQGTVNQRISVK